MNLEKLFKRYLELEEKQRIKKENYLNKYHLPLTYTKPSVSKACQNAFLSHRKKFNSLEQTKKAEVNDILGGMWIKA